MHTSEVVVVVPIRQINGTTTEIREWVWGEVSYTLLKELGKIYTQFNPSSVFLGKLTSHPYGVILGKQEPELFVCMVLAGRQAQQEAINYHVSALIERGQQKQNGEIGKLSSGVVIVDGSDPELTGHTLWHIELNKGTILPDCGLYFTEWGRAVATKDEINQIVDNLDQYALCMVTLRLEGEKE